MSRLSTVPAPILVLAGIVSVQFGGALAATLIPEIGAGGSVVMRLLFATVILVVTYVLVAVAVQAYAGFGTSGIGLANEENADDVLTLLGDPVGGAVMSGLLLFTVAISAASSTLRRRCSGGSSCSRYRYPSSRISNTSGAIRVQVPVEAQTS